MTIRTGKISPRVYARVAGLLYLVLLVGGMFGEMFVRSRLIVPGDAATTASNIRASAFLFRAGFASELLVFASDVALGAIFYVWLAPVSKVLSLTAAFFRLVMAAILGINLLNHFAVALLLSGDDYLKVFEKDQLDALALLFLKAHQHGYLIGLVFFGLHCAVLGYLMFESGYFPKVLGVLLMIAGAGYLGNSFTFFLFPSHAAGALSAVYLVPATIAEVSFLIWLLVKGVRADRKP